MPAIPLPVNGTLLPENRLKIAQDALFELDEVIGQLKCAMDVLEHITIGHIANKATSPAHHHIECLCGIIARAWPVFVGRGAA